jgi:heme exporter protein CcmD
MNWDDLLYMDGYGVYVWSACLAIAVAFTMELLLLRWRRRSILDYLGKRGANGKDGDEAAH